MTSSPVSSCTGILWFTSEMKKRGDAPYCFGRRGTLRAGTEALEKNAQVDNQTSKDDAPPGEFTYACLGYSQATAKMNRDGALPLCDVGVRFAMLRTAEKAAEKAPSDARPPEEASDALHPGAAARDAAEPRAVAASPPLITSEAVYTACERTVTKVSAFWSNALTNYPEKFVAFNGKMCATLATHVAYLGKLAKKAAAAIPPW